MSLLLSRREIAKQGFALFCFLGLGFLVLGIRGLVFGLIGFGIGFALRRVI